MVENMDHLSEEPEAAGCNMLQHIQDSQMLWLQHTKIALRRFEMF